ncbi:diguanylate cyclase [Vibrio crassostreae]|uniref:sensor domain-containing protein n=1 Tax=Vibrio crassostreae TaxID=246167 RepID=UPI0010E4F60F|nr:EAL domain-containing protein [Vibrio crassostreae]TCN92716.1 PAS domain S-box-containing protein/diguanylate cyclase (GGDEF)-like protein [Vibrio crassostreae]CAK1697184.1 diguanylate cyclase [Vibrio crassostreae]CAK1697598.1 diguanylate cyclase [Vibrio crassostreae]CAK1697674.1 diguanylate cyclase [Vibrio crassostreae]CAK1697749.1 diguanylate cyclase [Vibrio crassostreae]
MIIQQEKLSFFFSIVNQSSNAVIITNVDKDIIYANKKFEELSGYSLCDVLGKNPRIFKSNKTPVDNYHDMHRTLKTGSSWKGIFFNRHKDGTEYIEEAVISPITCDTGKVICYLAEKKDITVQMAAEENVRRLTHFDSLTELPNRAYFIEEANELMGFNPTKENSFAILFADLDRFKELNDSKGHLAGDMALKEVARRIEQALPSGDLAARVGGDEFVVIHKRATQESTAQLAAQLATALNQPISINLGQEAFLGVSIGAATWPLDGITLNDVLSHADLAMYEAKSTERDFVPYTEQIGTRYHRELELSIRLNKAIHNKDQFHLVYQPKFHTATNEVAGVEAMLRWDEPELGTISPEEFIPIAEKHRIILPIGRWVIKAACKQLHHWQSEGRFLPGRMALNISVQQFEHPDFFEDLIKMIADEGLSPSIFELEMTESIFISNPEKTMQVLKKLEHVGFCIAIDDFGTGFSSLSYLKKINAQILKIDKSFIDSLATSIHDKVIVKSVVDLAQNLGLAVVAEGVETEQQKRYLEEIGCDMIQGYYYLKPVTADELIRRIPFKVLPNG